jgi:uncharacterized protein
MSERRNVEGLEALPKQGPVFPLPGALLFPGGQLPLNIFEPRYVEMIDDALKTNRFIGMVQPASDAEAMENVPKLASVGCLGRLTQFAETDDGRYLITLTGVTRFRLLGEAAVPTRYRQCFLDYSPFPRDLQPEAGEESVDRSALLSAFRSFAQAKGLPIDWEGVHEAPTGALVNALAAMAPFGLREKQTLLETVDLPSRAALLTAMTEFELARFTGASTSLQ